MHKTVFIFKKFNFFFWGGGAGGVALIWTLFLSTSIDYQTTKNPLQSLQLRQKKLSSIIICQKKLWSLGFVKDSNRSQREKFSVFLEREYWLWLLFHVFVAILIKAPLPYVVVVTVGIFRWTLDELQMNFHSYDKWRKM